MSAAARAVLLAVALAAMAWLAVSWRDTRLFDDAARTANDPRATPAERRAALDDAERSKLLNPDRTGADVVRAALETRLGRPGEAQRILEQVVRREPENANAWLLLREFTRESDPRLSARAERRVRELDAARR